jgi:hypothetical protein
MARLTCALFAAALVVAPVGAEAADLVVWWEKGYYAQEDDAVREIIAAFEQGVASRSISFSSIKRSTPPRSRRHWTRASRLISLSAR